MKVISNALACLVVATMAGCYAMRAQSPEVKPAQDSVRLIHLYEHSDQTGNTCSFEVKNEDIYLNREEHGCENDEMKYIKLDNVHSAVEIKLESRDCDEEGGWVFVLKTFIDPITTIPISIESLKGLPAGSIIVAGVMKTDGWNEDEDSTNGKLSCVRVRVSDLP